MPVIPMLLSLILACAGKLPGAAPDSALTVQDTAPPPPPCIEEGEELWGKSETDYCCDGLVPVAVDSYSCDAGQDPAPPDLFYCTACGDGECGLKETFCNCTSDCADGEVGPTK